MSIRINGVDTASTIDNKSYNNAALGNVGVASSGDYKSTQYGKGTYHMAMNANLYEVQRTNNFEFVVDFGDTELLEAGLTTGGSTISPSVAQEVLRMSVSQASIPHFQQSTIQVKRGNNTLKYAGVPEFSEGSLTCVDYIGADTKAILMAWQNLSYNVATEKVGLASDYKKKAYLIEYSPDLQPVRQWVLYGCWITNLSESGFNSDTNDKNTITVTFTYDKAALDTESITVSNTTAK